MERLDVRGVRAEGEVRKKKKKIQKERKEGYTSSKKDRVNRGYRRCPRGRPDGIESSWGGVEARMALSDSAVSKDRMKGGGGAGGKALFGQGTGATQEVVEKGKRKSRQSGTRGKHSAGKCHEKQKKYNRTELVGLDKNDAAEKKGFTQEWGQGGKDQNLKGVLRKS